MDSKQRVLAALSFQRPDRIPLYNEFFPEFTKKWRTEKGLGSDANPTDYYESDIELIAPDETPFPTERGVLDESEEHNTLARSGWGAVRRLPKGVRFEDSFLYPAQAFPIIEVAVAEKRDLDRLEFESPQLESRFPSVDEVEEKKRRRCLFVKTGGPYLRSSYLRGSTQWLMDLVDDSDFARQLAMRVTEHITAVGLEAMRRYDLYDTGLFFHDDMASNRSTMFSPATFRRVFLPCYEKMFDAYRQAGARNIIFHSDGNVESVLDMMLDAGINAINPVEYKAGMDVVRLRKRYGKRLAFIGGLDNAGILPTGTKKEIESHVMHVLSVGRGLVAGAHSIGPDVPVENYELAWQLIRSAEPGESTTSS